MPEKLAIEPGIREWSTGSSTTPPGATRRLDVGWPQIQDLEQLDVYMYGGPTGRSAYWPELFSFLHPACATTDTTLNLVDEVWLGQADPKAGFTVAILAPPAGDREHPPLAEVVAELRQMLDMPVAQIAAICGVSRRQLYNFLEGRPASTERESWIYAVREAVGRLDDAAEHDHRRLRAAMLLPVLEGRSFVEVARQGDRTRLGSVTAALEKRIREGFRGRVRRPIRLRRGNGEVEDFLGEYRDRGD